MEYDVGRKNFTPLMTFLNPLVLTALAAAAIPVILHLLSLRKLRTVEFSTLSFLKELQQTKIRRLKIRQIVLLIVRTLMIVLLVLAFARPALRGGLFGSVGTNARTTYVIILDDSFSMSASDEHGERFRQATLMTERILDLMKDGDEVALIKTSDLPGVTIDPASQDVNAVRQIIGEAKISVVRRTLDDALKTAARIASRSKNANKEVYIISDCQRSSAGMTTLEPNGDEANLFDERVRLFVCSVGDGRPIGNLSIDSVEVLSRIMEEGKPVSLVAGIRNFSATRVEDFVVSAFLDGVRVAQQSVSVDAWGSAQVQFLATPKRTGIIKGKIELEHDALEQDNVRYFTLGIPEQINVTVVSNTDSETRFVRMALGSGSEEARRALISFESLSFDRLAVVNFLKTDVVAMVGARALSPGILDRLRNFVHGGGGLILFPSSDGNIRDLNDGLLPALSIPAVDRLVSSDDNSGRIFSRSLDKHHPLFESLFEKLPLGRAQDPPTVILSYAKSLMRSVGASGRTIISFDHQGPFLSEHEAGSGKILFYSISPVLSWSDFPLQGIFAPLVYRSVIYVSSEQHRQFSFIAGESAVVTLSGIGSGSAQAPFRLVSPGGVEEVLPQIPSPASPAGGKLVLQSSPVTETGLYDIMNSAGVATSFAVNVDWTESDGRIMDEEDWALLWQSLGVNTASVHTVSGIDRLHPEVMEAKFGVELWKHCLIAVLLLVLVEMMIARDSRKEFRSLTGEVGHT